MYINKSEFAELGDQDIEVLLSFNIRHAEQLVALLSSRTGQLALESLRLSKSLNKVREIADKWLVSNRNRTSLSAGLTYEQLTQPEPHISPYGLGHPIVIDGRSLEEQDIRIGDPMPNFANGGRQGERPSPIEQNASSTSDQPPLPPRHVIIHDFDRFNFFPPARYQGRRGTCAAFVGCHLFEEYLFVNGQQGITFSPQYVYSQAKQIDNSPDEEGTTFPFIMEVLRESGVCRESDVAYNPQHDWGQMAMFEARRYNPREVRNLAKQFRVLQYEHFVDATDIEAIKRSLFEGHAVGMAVPVFHDAWRNNYTKRRGEVQLPLFKGEKLLDDLVGGHAITLYGYVDDGAEDLMDDETLDPPSSGSDSSVQVGDADLGDDTQLPRAGGGYFIFRNTWGTDWGSSQLDCPSGYGMLPYKYVALFALDVVIIKRISAKLGDGPSVVL